MLPLGIMYCEGIGFTITAPVVNLPDATAVCWDVDGVMVAADWIVNCSVADFVPAAIVPADWVAVAVINPVEELMLITGVACATGVVTVAAI